MGYWFRCVCGTELHVGIHGRTGRELSEALDRALTQEGWTRLPRVPPEDMRWNTPDSVCDRCLPAYEHAQRDLAAFTFAVEAAREARTIELREKTLSAELDCQKDLIEWLKERAEAMRARTLWGRLGRLVARMRGKR